MYIWNSLEYIYDLFMQGLKIILPQNLDTNSSTYHFYRHYYHVNYFIDNKKTFDTDNTYYGRTFMKQSNNVYFVMVDKDDCDPCLYNIPNREQFLLSLKNYNENKIVLQIQFLYDSMIYVAHNNSLNVNNVGAEPVPWSRPSEFAEFPFTPLPRGQGIIIKTKKPLTVPKRERSESINFVKTKIAKV